MKAVIQRVSKASVTIRKRIKTEIRSGLLVLVGFEDSDNEQDVEWLCNKIAHLRIFNDRNGVMNLSLLDTKGEILLVSQFTLHALTRKGNRPSYIRAAKSDIAIPLYELSVATLSQLTGKEVGSGEFGADMQVELINDGPVTIIIDSKDKV